MMGLQVASYVVDGSFDEGRPGSRPRRVAKKPRVYTISRACGEHLAEEGRLKEPGETAD